MSQYSFSDQEFVQFQRFIYDAAGITLSSARRALVSGRLAKRLVQHRFASYDEYFRLLVSGSAEAEVQTAVDLLTTNETYFFREAKHFELLRRVAQETIAAAPERTEPFRVWSAATASGEEAYSIAMVLADCLRGPWQVLGSDISARVLQLARAGSYAAESALNIPTAYVRRYCSTGAATPDGGVRINAAIRAHVQFAQINLNETLPQQGMFDVIFVRNVLTYFNAETRRAVIERVLAQLRPGGYLLIGHADGQNEACEAVQAVAPSIYRKR